VAVQPFDVENEERMNDDLTKQEATTYDFGTDPISVNLHRPNAATQNKETHRMHKPTVEQWLLWGHELYEERRNLSPEELEEESKLDDDDPLEWAYQKQYNEHEASRRLYEAVAIDVTAYKLGKAEELQPSKTYPLTPELIGRVIGSDVAISGLYHCYCELENASGQTIDEIEDVERTVIGDANETSGENVSEEIRVRQTIGSSETAPSVVHVLRTATDEEGAKFLQETVRTYAVVGKPDTMRICLNLRAASDIYDAMLLRVEKGTVNGQQFDEKSRAVFKEAINPVFKLKVLEAALNTRLWHFASDP
jgi:hypothetical protein